MLENMIASYNIGNIKSGDGFTLEKDDLKSFRKLLLTTPPALSHIRNWDFIKDIICDKYGLSLTELILCFNLIKHKDAINLRGDTYTNLVKNLKLLDYAKSVVDKAGLNKDEQGIISFASRREMRDGSGAALTSLVGSGSFRSRGASSSNNGKNEYMEANLVIFTILVKALRENGVSVYHTDGNSIKIIPSKARHGDSGYAEVETNCVLKVGAYYYTYFTKLGLSSGAEVDARKFVSDNEGGTFANRWVSILGLRLLELQDKGNDIFKVSDRVVDMANVVNELKFNRDCNLYAWAFNLSNAKDEKGSCVIDVVRTITSYRLGSGKSSLMMGAEEHLLNKYKLDDVCSVLCSVCKLVDEHMLRLPSIASMYNIVSKRTDDAIVKFSRYGFGVTELIQENVDADNLMLLCARVSKLYTASINEPRTDFKIKALKIDLGDNMYGSVYIAGLIRQSSLGTLLQVDSDNIRMLLMSADGKSIRADYLGDSLWVKLSSDRDTVRIDKEQLLRVDTDKDTGGKVLMTVSGVVDNVKLLGDGRSFCVAYKEGKSGKAALSNATTYPEEAFIQFENAIKEEMSKKGKRVARVEEPVEPKREVVARKKVEEPKPERVEAPEELKMPEEIEEPEATSSLMDKADNIVKEETIEDTSSKKSSNPPKKRGRPSKSGSSVAGSTTTKGKRTKQVLVEEWLKDEPTSIENGGDIDWSDFKI